MSKLISITQASELTGLSVTSIRRRVAAKSLPAVRANTAQGKLLFDIDLLNQILRQEAYSNLSNCDISVVQEPEPEPEQSRSYLANLFKPSEDATDAEAERDRHFGYPPRNTNKSGSFTV